MKTLIITLFLTLIFSVAFGQKQEVIQIDSLPYEGLLLKQGWKFKTGDNLNWAKSDYNDSDWKNIDPTLEISELPQIFDRQINGAFARL